MLYVHSFLQSNCSPAMILLCILSMVTISMVSRNSFTCLPSLVKQLILCNYFLFYTFMHIDVFCLYGTSHIIFKVGYFNPSLLMLFNNSHKIVNKSYLIHAFVFRSCKHLTCFIGRKILYYPHTKSLPQYFFVSLTQYGIRWQISVKWTQYYDATQSFFYSKGSLNYIVFHKALLTHWFELFIKLLHSKIKQLSCVAAHKVFLRIYTPSQSHRARRYPYMSILSLSCVYHYIIFTTSSNECLQFHYG